MMYDLVAFDADDTLWNNEVLYTQAKAKFAAALAPFHPTDLILPALDQVEVNNLAHYGYGIKSFTLSMIETALTMMDDRPAPAVFDRILAISRGILSADVELFPGVEATLRVLNDGYRLMLLTKGDHFEQQRKVARSNLSGYFQAVEIVGEKTPGAYRRILERYQVRPDRFLMIGNSLRSDVLPVLEIGGEAVYIPYAGTWDHENVPEEQLVGLRYYEVGSIVDVPALLTELRAARR